MSAEVLTRAGLDQLGGRRTEIEIRGMRENLVIVTIASASDLSGK